MPSHKTFYRLGRLTVAISGDGPIPTQVRNELSPLGTREEGPADVEYAFVPTLSGQPGIQTGNVAYGGGNLQVEYGHFRYEMILEETRLIINVECPSHDVLGNWKRRVWRYVNFNYLTPEEGFAKNFLYAVFDWTVQVCQLDRGQSHVHASVITNDKRGIAFLAWGGVGKTTALLNLCFDHGWNYLSDDLGLVDSDGRLYRSPKKLQVYGYNVSNHAGLRRALLKQRTVADLINWHAHYRCRGPKHVRRRVTAESLFGDQRVAASCVLTDVVFLERTTTSVCSAHDISVDEIARRMAATVLSEIEPFPALARQARAGGVRFPYDANLVESKTYEVLCAAFARARPILIRVGRDSTPQELTGFLRDTVIERNNA